MATPNGTLRLVAANPEPTPEPVGLGATASDAYATLQTAIQSLQASANQLLASNPGNTLAANVLQQATAINKAASDWTAALQAAAQTQVDAATAAANAMSAQNTAQLAAIKTLQNQLQAAGITPTAPGRTTAPAPAPAPPTTPAAAGTFTTGQTAAATVFGAIAGWFGHQIYDEYRGRRA